MAAAMGGLDALVFTGGVGENAAPIRSEACRDLGFLRLAIDEELNQGLDLSQGDADLSAGGAEARVLVVRAREDLEIAREVRALTGG
jgi:acetate kinase